MARAHVGLEQQPVVVGLQRPQLCHVLGGFPVGDPGVVQSRGHQHGRIVARFQLVIWRIGPDVVEGVLVLNGIAPLRPLNGREGQGVVQHGVQGVHEGDVGGDGAPQLRGLVHHGAHELSAGAAPGDGDAALRAIAPLHQVKGDVHEVVECVGAPVQLAGLIPVVSQVIAAANVGDGEDEPPVQQRQPRGGKRWRKGEAIGAVAVEVQGRGAVHGGLPAADEGHWNLHAVTGGGQRPLRHIFGGIVPAGNLLHLANFEVTIANVIVEYGRWRHHRRVLQTQRASLEFRVRVQSNAVRRLRERHVDGLPRAVNQAHMVQAVDALLHSDKVPECLEGPDVVRIRRLHQWRPGPFGGIVGGRYGQARVLVPVVGADDEAVALVVHRVFVAGAAGSNQERRGLRGRRGHEAHLGSDVVAGGDDGVLPGSGGRQPDEEAGIRLLVYDEVLCRRLAEDMPANLPRAPVLVHHGIEERGVVGCPHRASHGSLDFVLPHLPGVQVLYCHPVPLGAVGIRAVG